MLTPKLAQINGAKLEMFDGGNQNGEPVVFIHGTGSVGCQDVLQEPTLAEHYRMIAIHRRGFGKSDPADPSMSIEDNAADVREALRLLGIERAHFVSQSAGSIILLQYVDDYPGTVHTLTLLEPPIPWITDPDPEYLASSEKAGTLYQAGEKAGAVHTFASEVAGQDYYDQFDANLPDGWFEQWVDEIDTMIQVEVPALGQWTFSREDAARINQPVLNVMGSDTRPYFRTCFETVKSWIPHAESVVLPDATHGAVQMNPKGFAELLADFFTRHPISRG